MSGNTYRQNTKVIQIGNVSIGGGNPIAIQSMTNTRTDDVEATVAQILRLAHEVGLINHPVNQGCFAVVDVSDDRYVSNFCHTLLKIPRIY